MEQAIKKAIEGGWNPTFGEQFNKQLVKGVRGEFFYIPVGSCLLDPDFWKCLGKALGWQSLKDYRHKVVGQIYIKDEYGYTKFTGPEWYENWHDFLDYLIAGKDADLFFKELLQ